MNIIPAGTGLSDAIVGQLMQSVYTVTVSSLTINGVNVQPQIKNSLIPLTYKDVYSDSGTAQADTLEIVISDPEGLFRQTFQLKANMPVACSIAVTGWNAPQTGTMTKDFGSMYVRSVRIDSAKSSGTVVRICCTSIPPTSPFRLQKKSAQYPVQPGSTPITLSQLADIVCQTDGITGGCQYTAGTDPAISSVAQHDHSDSYMLKKLCQEHDFTMKYKNDTLYISDMESVEAQAPSFNLVCPTQQQIGGINNSGMLHWEFCEETEDCSYGQCEVSTIDPTTGQNVTGNSRDSKNPNGAKLIDHMTLHTPESMVTMDQILLDTAPDQTSDQMRYRLRRLGGSLDYTVPDDNEELPEQPDNTTVTPNPAIEQLANEKAKAIHKFKNRRGNRFQAGLPILLSLESGTTATTSGFSPDCDAIRWIVGEVEIKVNGKSSEGSTVQISMFPALPNITN
jgi:hypothetical protein